MDICSLFRAQAREPRPSGGEEPSAEAYLFSYSAHARDPGRRTSHRTLSKRCAGRWPITASTLDRSPELEECLLWIYKSHQRVEQQIAPILAVLERRLRSSEA